MSNQVFMASYKKSRDQLQLGLVQAITMTAMHFIHTWTDWQLQFKDIAPALLGQCHY